MMGWETKELNSLKIIHLKPTGTSKGEGIKKTWEKDGYINYYMNGYLWYFALRVLSRSIQWLNPMIGFYMIKGYTIATINKKPRETQVFKKYLRKTQVTNLVNWIRFAISICSERVSERQSACDNDGHK